MEVPVGVVVAGDAGLGSMPLEEVVELLDDLGRAPVVGGVEHLAQLAPEPGQRREIGRRRPLGQPRLRAEEASEPVERGQGVCAVDLVGLRRHQVDA